MAIGHYQFEVIHPFADGNGRTGRISSILFLVQGGLLTIGVLTQIKSGREPLFLHPKLMELLSGDTNDFGAYGAKRKAKKRETSR
jgi:hypothetical protein